MHSAVRPAVDPEALVLRNDDGRLIEHAVRTLPDRARQLLVLRERNTDVAGVPLEVDGDFRIDNVLNPAPSDCASPVLLIRNTGGVWFAAGIPRFSDD